MKTLLIGIAGGSGSGKTTLAEKIASELSSDKVLLISLDHYYKDLSYLNFEERKKVNFDNPDSIDWELFREHINLLLQNKEIQMPRYSFADHTRAGVEIVTPRNVIIIEGIFALCDDQISGLMDVAIFVETDSDIRLIRRIKRDVIERSRNLESIINQWETQVAPSYNLFIAPTARKAHIIVPEDPSGSLRTTVVKIIVSMISDFLK